MGVAPSIVWDPSTPAPSARLVEPTRFGPTSVYEVIEVVRAGLDDDEAAAFIGISAAMLREAFVFHSQNVAAFDAAPRPETPLVQLARYRAALDFYATDGFYERRPGGTNYIDGDHGYRARSVLGRQNAVDRELDEAERREIDQRFAEVSREIEAGTLQTSDWSEVEAMFEQARREMERRSSFEAEVLGEVLGRLLRHADPLPICRWLLRADDALGGRPIDLLAERSADELAAAAPFTPKES